jgi:hypothetical protein
MKNKFTFLLLILSFFFGNKLLSQDYSNKFKQITTYELAMKEYERDKMAEALIIYEIGKTKFYYDNTEGFQIIFECQTKIKILSEAGVDYSEVSIPFYQDNTTYEKIEKIEAYTYNLENGLKQVTPLDPEQIYKEKVGDNRYAMKFALPAVKPGSVIEYKYTLTTPRIFYLQDWYFQSKIPTVCSEYEIYMIPFYQYTWLLQGASKFDSYSEQLDNGIPNYLGPLQYKNNILKYGMKNIPAFRDEEFITSTEDYIMKIDFQLSAWTDIYGVKIDVITTWPALCKELLNDSDFGKYIKASAKQSAKEFNYNLLTGMTEREKYDAIIQFVKSNYNWNGYKGIGSSKPVGKFMDEKTGSSADLNLFLCGMLQKAGLVSNPVIISTRDHGKIRKSLPFLSFFNYVIVLVNIDGKNQLADATDSYISDLLVPQYCLNDIGLIVQEKAEEWVVLTSSTPSALKYTFQTFLPDGSDSLQVSFEVNATNYEAARLKKMYASKYENLEEYFHDNNFLPIDSVTTKNYKETNKDFSIKCKASYAKETINNKIYIAPFFGTPLSENLFTQTKRYYPIDMEYPKARQFYSEIKIPEGYKVEYIPQNTTVNAELVTINYFVKQSDDILIVSGSYLFNKAVYDATDYTNLKFYCNDIIKKFNEKIVLVKTK